MYQSSVLTTSSTDAPSRTVERNLSERVEREWREEGKRERENQDSEEKGKERVQQGKGRSRMKMKIDGIAVAPSISSAPSPSRDNQHERVRAKLRRVVREILTGVGLRRMTSSGRVRALRLLAPMALALDVASVREEGQRGRTRGERIGGHGDDMSGGLAAIVRQEVRKMGRKRDPICLDTAMRLVLLTPKKTTGATTTTAERFRPLFAERQRLSEMISIASCLDHHAALYCGPGDTFITTHWLALAALHARRAATGAGKKKRGGLARDGAPGSGEEKMEIEKDTKRQPGNREAEVEGTERDMKEVEEEERAIAALGRACLSSLREALLPRGYDPLPLRRLKVAGMLGSFPRLVTPNALSGGSIRTTLRKASPSFPLPPPWDGETSEWTPFEPGFLGMLMEGMAVGTALSERPRNARRIRMAAMGAMLLAVDIDPGWSQVGDGGWGTWVLSFLFEGFPKSPPISVVFFCSPLNLLVSHTLLLHISSFLSHSLFPLHPRFSSSFPFLVFRKLISGPFHFIRHCLEGKRSHTWWAPPPLHPRPFPLHTLRHVVTLPPPRHTHLRKISNRFKITFHSGLLMQDPEGFQQLFEIIEAGSSTAMVALTKGKDKKNDDTASKRDQTANQNGDPKNNENQQSSSGVLNTRAAMMERLGTPLSNYSELAFHRYRRTDRYEGIPLAPVLPITSLPR